jgi:cysteine desulfurase family protein
MDVIYLDNAATSWPKPPEVAAAMGRFLAQDAANPGRAGHRMAVAAERMLDRVRKALADLIGGDDPARLIFALNGTDALNIAIKGVLGRWIDGGQGKGARPHVITSALEHNSVSRPLEALARRGGGAIDVTRVGYSPTTGQIDPDEIGRAIQARTRLIVLTHASNVLGTIQPIAAVGALARAHGVPFLVDAAQTMGVVPIDVAAQHIDLLAFPGHKSLLGPTGTGGLYVGSAITLEALSPLREGGTGGDSAHPTMPEEFPYFLEGGTPNTVGIAGLEAALRHLKTRGQAAILDHERGLIDRLIGGLSAFGEDRCRIYGPKSAAASVGALSFNLSGMAPEEVGGILDESFGIAVRPGLHCAPYAHQGLGTFPAGTIRVSPGPFSTAEQIDRLLEALGQILE